MSETSGQFCWDGVAQMDFFFLCSGCWWPVVHLLGWCHWVIERRPMLRTLSGLSPATDDVQYNHGRSNHIPFSILVLLCKHSKRIMLCLHMAVQLAWWCTIGNVCNIGIAMTITFLWPVPDRGAIHYIMRHWYRTRKEHLEYSTMACNLVNDVRKWLRSYLCKMAFVVKWVKE